MSIYVTESMTNNMLPIAYKTATNPATTASNPPKPVCTAAAPVAILWLTPEVDADAPVVIRDRLPELILARAAGVLEAALLPVYRGNFDVAETELADWMPLAMGTAGPAAVCMPAWLCATESLETGPAVAEVTAPLLEG